MLGPNEIFNQSELSQTANIELSFAGDLLSLAQELMLYVYIISFVLSAILLFFYFRYKIAYKNLLKDIDEDFRNKAKSDFAKRFLN